MITKTYALSIDRDNKLQRIGGEEMDGMMTQEAAGLVLDGWVRRYAADHGLDQVKNYTNILRTILESASTELKAAYAGTSGIGKALDNTPADEADRRTKLYMREKGEKDYSAALRAVLSADEELKEAYSR